MRNEQKLFSPPIINQDVTMYLFQISNDLHFHGPISGQKHVTIFEGSYQYVNLIDSTASVFVVVDSSRTSKTGAMARSIAQCWPILVVCIFMTLLTGILIWMAVSTYHIDRFDYTI